MMKKGQLVRIIKGLEGSELEKGTVGFVIEGHGEKIAVMGLDELGVILGAGIFEQEDLEECDDEKYLEAKAKYDSRLNAAEMASEQGRLNMIRTVANETGFEIEDITQVLDIWDRLHHDIVQTLR